MRRAVPALFAACVAALIAAACGSGGPSPSPSPSPTPGGGGGQQPPPVVNTPPVVKSITVSDTRVEAGTPVTLTAIVEDAETPVANLSFGWTSPVPGSVSGTGNGSTIAFTPGTDFKTPADIEITVTVTERYTSNGVPAENKATGSVMLHVNNSAKELAELSVRFLTDFATSSVPAAKCVSEFSDNCRGKKDEFNDIDDNRHDFLIVGSTIRHSGLDIASNRLTATVHTFCSFTSRVITTQPREEGCQNGACPLNSQGTATGDCWTTNVYENGRWFLCESHFTSKSTLSPMMRAFFGIRPPDLP